MIVAAGRLLFGLAGAATRAPLDVAGALARRATTRIVVARAIGEMAVNLGVREVEARLGRGAAVPVAVDDEPPLGADTESALSTADERGVDVPAGAADDLPIAGYESLAASQVVAMLPTLSGNDLAAIETFEQANRRRRTVLGKIDQLRRT